MNEMMSDLIIAKINLIHFEKLTEVTTLIEQALYYLHIDTEIGQHLMIRMVDDFDNENGDKSVK